MTDESVTRSFGLLVKMGLTCGVSNWGICWPGVSPLVQVPGSFRPFLTYFLYMYFLHCFIPNILDPDWCIVALKVVRFNSRLKSHPFSVISQPSILFIIVTILMLWMCHESKKHSTFGVFFSKPPIIDFLVNGSHHTQSFLTFFFIVISVFLCCACRCAFHLLCNSLSVSFL
jgi:magnesium-transporting ATPase (P-type)